MIYLDECITFTLLYTLTWSFVRCIWASYCQMLVWECCATLFPLHLLFR